MISNSTPPILLAKMHRLDLLKMLFGTVLIPEAVKIEVLREEKEGSLAIQKALEEEWIAIANPKKELELNLDEGETAALSLAKEKGDSLIVDDEKAIKAARLFGISYLRTTSLLFLAVKKRIFTKKQARELLNFLLKEGYYLSPAYYAALLEKLV